MDSHLNILRNLISRLEPLVGDLARPGKLSSWGATGLDAMRERSIRGDGHLSRALRIAQRAIASGNAEDMELAALYAPTFERTGLQMRAKYEEERKHQERQTGGLARGKEQTEKSKEIWGPYVDEFKALIAKGRTEKDARKEVVRRMAREAFMLPLTGQFPSEKTIREHLAIKKISEPS